MVMPNDTRGLKKCVKLQGKAGVMYLLMFTVLALARTSFAAEVADEDAPALDKSGKEATIDGDGGGGLRDAKKRIGRFRRKDDLSSILFPGVAPVSLKFAPFQWIGYDPSSLFNNVK
jgi:hypothetical protein